MIELPDIWSDRDCTLMPLDEEYYVSRSFWSWIEDLQRLADSGDEQAKQTLLSYFGEPE